MTARMTVPCQSGEEDWKLDGLCRSAEYNPDLWHEPDRFSVREAKNICRKCEVMRECAIWAFVHDEIHGVWGGLSARDRNRIKNRIGVDRALAILSDQRFVGKLE